ncbi:MAG: cell division ATP-binding protein FtsE [Clostridia bacterium]|nr:cell division ATP-binding protein FtsE [Clostridia bacterium]
MIQFKNVSKTYESNTGESHALNNVNITINDKEFVFILGASGAGKSTFLKLIMREDVPTEGDIILDNQSLATMKRRKVPYLRRKMGIVFQDFRLIEKMNVFDNVAFAMRVTGYPSKKIKKRVLYVLDLVGLRHKVNSFPSELSGGEKQRVSLARALVNAPDIIIADEPTGNIDPEMSVEIMTLLSEINKNGTTVIIVTHEHEFVQQFGGRVIVLDKGNVVSDSANLGGEV